MEKTIEPLTVSIVIPVYNEERHIKKTLESIARQNILPSEVIIVDNNCTDKTLDIVRRYKFCRIITEKKQGRGYARSRGLSSATSDIIGRIDADSVLDPNWTQVALDSFNDPEVMAITGPGYTLGFPKIFGYQPLPKYYSGIWSRLYLIGASGIMRLNALWGANMVIRRSAWKKVKSQVCNDDNKVHEDQDLAIMLSSVGLRSKYTDKLRISMNGLSFFYWPKYYEYMHRSFGTFFYRIRNGDLSTKTVIRKNYIIMPITVLVVIIPTLFYTFLSFGFYYLLKPFERSIKGS
jgi:glycosyltransferase involved in cell wall biosynthesis